MLINWMVGFRVLSYLVSLLGMLNGNLKRLQRVFRLFGAPQSDNIVGLTEYQNSNLEQLATLQLHLAP